MVVGLVVGLVVGGASAPKLQGCVRLMAAAQTSQLRGAHPRLVGGGWGWLGSGGGWWHPCLSIKVAFIYIFTYPLPLPVDGCDLVDHSRTTGRPWGPWDPGTLGPWGPEAHLASSSSTAARFLRSLQGRRGGVRRGVDHSIRLCVLILKP